MKAGLSIWRLWEETFFLPRYQIEANDQLASGEETTTNSALTASANSQIGSFMENLTKSQAESLLIEIAGVRGDLAALTDRLNAVLALVPGVAPDATAAQVARESGRLRGFYKVREFAAVIGRSPQYVSSRRPSGRKRLLAGRPVQMGYRMSAVQ